MGLKYFDTSTIRFLIVGVINTVVGTGVMFVFYNIFHTGYWIASASNYVIGSIVSYFLNKYFTFKSKKRSMKEAMRFVVNIICCYFVAYGVAKPCIACLFNGFQQNTKDNIAMLMGMCLFVILNYFGQKFFVFKIKET